MKKSLKLIEDLRLVSAIFYVVAAFIYLIFQSVVIGASDSAGGAAVFSLVLGWLVFCAAVVLTILLIKQRLDGGYGMTDEKKLVQNLWFAFALSVVGLFATVGVNLLMIFIFILCLTEYFIRDALNKTGQNSDGDREEPVQLPPASEENEPEPALEAPKVKLVAPIRRGDPTDGEEE